MEGSEFHRIGAATEMAQSPSVWCFGLGVHIHNNCLWAGKPKGFCCTASTHFYNALMGSKLSFSQSINQILHTGLLKESSYLTAEKMASSFSEVSDKGRLRSRRTVKRGRLEHSTHLWCASRPLAVCGCRLCQRDGALKARDSSDDAACHSLLRRTLGSAPPRILANPGPPPCCQNRSNRRPVI